jgi:hypothetical protein
VNLLAVDVSSYSFVQVQKTVKALILLIKIAIGGEGRNRPLSTFVLDDSYNETGHKSN